MKSTWYSFPKNNVYKKFIFKFAYKLSGPKQISQGLQHEMTSSISTPHWWEASPLLSRVENKIHQ